MIKQSPYQILGLNNDFEYKDIKRAYRRKIRENPPEKNPKEFTIITNAYDILSNEEYFYNGVTRELYSLNIEVELKDKSIIDYSEHLKNIFEVPFAI